VTLQLHRPDGRAGLTPTAGQDRKWRAGLRARRWRPAALANSEMNPTSTWLAVVFWVALAALTFGLLMWGYGTHFWR
jgi:hypothetical protein